MNIFDADIHWIEMEKEMIDRAGLNRLRVMPRDGWDRTLGGKFPERAPSSMQLESFLEENRIKMAAIHPTRCLSLGLIPEPDVATRIADAFHDFVLDQMLSLPKNKLIPIALAVPQNIQHTVKRLVDYKKQGFKGILLLPHGHNKLLGDPEFEDFYAACQELELTVTIHPNSFGAIGISGLTRFAEVHCLSFPFELIRQFTNMVLSGIFEKYPKLHVAFLEAGVGWIPYWINRLDDEFEKRNEELPIKQPPSSILQQAKIYASCSTYESEISRVDEMLGGGVLWQSDYPHWDHVDYKSVELIWGNLDEELFKKVMWKNPLECYLITN